MDHARTGSADSALTTASTISSVSSASSLSLSLSLSLAARAPACARLLDTIHNSPPAAEMPLRTAYSLNSSPASSAPTSPLSSASTSPAASSCQPSSSSSAPPQLPATAPSPSLAAALASLQLQSAPASLPPAFVSSFLRRTFTPQLHQVDFCHALTGLDYLKDLEARRRRDVAAALARTDAGDGTSDWLARTEQLEHDTDALYTSLFLGLRQWIMINEMSLAPFNRNNCHAMLNTLFPPAIAGCPASTSAIPQDLLQAQRATFFRYIKAVETSGPAVLDPLVRPSLQDRQPGCGWSAVREVLERYLENTSAMIQHCRIAAAATSASAGSASSSVSSLVTPSLVHSVASSTETCVPVEVRPASSSSAATTVPALAIDTSFVDPDESCILGESGFGPASASATGPTGAAGGTLSVPSLPAAIAKKQSSGALSAHTVAAAVRRPTALGRIAREFRRFTSKRSSAVDELVPPPATAEDEEAAGRGPAFRIRSLRKMRSFGGMSGQAQAQAQARACVEPFDPAEMRRARDAWASTQG